VNVPPPQGALVPFGGPFQAWAWGLLDRVVLPISAAASHRVPEVDLVDVLRREFQTFDDSSLNVDSVLVASARAATTVAL
jgi:hypothetical protein